MTIRFSLLLRVTATSRSSSRSLANAGSVSCFPHWCKTCRRRKPRRSKSSRWRQTTNSKEGVGDRESGANSRRVQTLIVILGGTDHPATHSRARKDVARQDRRSNFLAGSTITHSPLSSPKSAWRYCRSCRRSPFVNTGETRRSHANAAFLSVGLLKSNLRSQIVGNRGSLMIRLELLWTWLNWNGPCRSLNRLRWNSSQDYFAGLIMRGKRNWLQGPMEALTSRARY